MSSCAVPAQIREMYPDFEHLLSQEIKYAASRARHAEFEDAVQEGRLALLQSLSRFDLNLCKSSLLSYVRIAIDLHVRGINKSEWRKTMHLVPSEVEQVSVDYHSMDVDRFVASLEKTLQPRERSVLKTLIDMNGCSHKQMSKALGLNKNQMDYSIRKIRATFRDLAGGNRFIDLFDSIL